MSIIHLPKPAALPLPAASAPEKQNNPVTNKPPIVIDQIILDGDLGASQTLKVMRKIVHTYPCKAAVVDLAEQIVVDCKTDTERINAIHQFVQSRLQYQKDPPDMEEIKSPCKLLGEAKQNGVAKDDCDGFAVMYASLFDAIHMGCGFRAVANKKGKEAAQPLDHVFCFVWNRDIEKWVIVDIPDAMGRNWNGHRSMVEMVRFQNGSSAHKPLLNTLFEYVKFLFFPPRKRQGVVA